MKYYCKKCNHETDRFGWSCKEEFIGFKKFITRIPLINVFFTCPCWCKQEPMTEKRGCE